MDKFNRSVTGISAFFCASSFLFGIVLLVTTMLPYVENANDTLFAINFVRDNLLMLQIWNSIIYIGFGIGLVLLVTSLHQQLLKAAPRLSQLALILGIIWAGLVIAAGLIANVGLDRVHTMTAINQNQAQSLWLAVHTLMNSLGGSNEIIGGLWIILVSLALRGHVSKILVGVGIIGGVAGILTSVPALGALGVVFGLVMIVWFLWIACLSLTTTITDLEGIKL